MNPDAGLEELMRTAARINDAVAQVRGQGESADGRVRIEVTADGAISNLYLHDEVKRMPPHELGRAIRDAQRKAVDSIMLSIKEIQSEITENSYTTTILRNITESSPQPTTTQPSRRPTKGMTEEELDASQEQFNFDPLGRRKHR
jgi:DNA-binding protein YbaB